MIEEFQSGVAGEFLRFHQEEPLTGCGRKDLIEKMLSRGKFGFPSDGFIILDRSASRQDSREKRVGVSGDQEYLGSGWRFFQGF